MNFFQSSQAFRLFQALDNYKPIIILAEENEEILGSILAVFISEGNGLKGHFSNRCIVWDGPLVKNDNNIVFNALLNQLNEIASKKAIYTEFRNFRNLSEQKTLFENRGYIFHEHFNYIVSVSSLEEAKAKLSNSKKRQINKSIINGAGVIEADLIEQVKEFYDILKNLYNKKVKKPLSPFDLFEKFFNLKDLGKFFLIQYNGKIIGGIMCPIYKDKIYEWYICGLDGEFENIYPSVLATWAPIEYAAKNGIKYFDFLGAGSADSDYGVREFKSKFGGELNNYGRFVRINKPILYKIGKIGLKFYNILK